MNAGEAFYFSLGLVGESQEDVHARYGDDFDESLVETVRSTCTCDLTVHF
jgi:hypothetical protein